VRFLVSTFIPTLPGENTAEKQAWLDRGDNADLFLVPDDAPVCQPGPGWAWWNMQDGKEAARKQRAGRYA
jgi:hypothetical protein